MININKVMRMKYVILHLTFHRQIGGSETVLVEKHVLPQLQLIQLSDMIFALL